MPSAWSCSSPDAHHKEVRRNAECCSVHAFNGFLDIVAAHSIWGFVEELSRTCVSVMGHFLDAKFVDSDKNWTFFWVRCAMWSSLNAANVLQIRKYAPSILTGECYSAAKQINGYRRCTYFCSRQADKNNRSNLSWQTPPQTNRLRLMSKNVSAYVGLQVGDLTPNIGLFWYFFSEIFSGFRLFFLFVFHAISGLFLLPLAIRFPDQPLLVFFIQCAMIAFLKPYPTLTDSALYLVRITCCSVTDLMLESKVW